MKTLSKFAVAATMLAAVSTFAQAQTPAIATVQMTALVNAAVTATSPSGLSFGTVVQGGSGVTVSPQSVSTAGVVNIGGVNNEGITITMTSLPTDLTFSSATLGVSAYKYCYVQASASQSTCTVSSTTSGGTVTGQSLSASGVGFLYLGATLAAPSASQTPGTYTGQMTITVTTP